MSDDSLYAVVDSSQGLFIGVITAPDAITAIARLWKEYGRNSGYELYLRIDSTAYDKAREVLQTYNPAAHSASHKR